LLNDEVSESSIEQIRCCTFCHAGYIIHISAQAKPSYASFYLFEPFINNLKTLFSIDISSQCGNAQADMRFYKDKPKKNKLEFVIFG